VNGLSSPTAFPAWVHDRFGVGQSGGFAASTYIHRQSDRQTLVKYIEFQHRSESWMLFETSRWIA